MNFKLFQFDPIFVQETLEFPCLIWAILILYIYMIASFLLFFRDKSYKEWTSYRQNKYDKY